MSDSKRTDSLFLAVLQSSGVRDAAQPPVELPRSKKLIIGSSAERSGFVVTGQGVADVHCAIGRLKSGGWALKDLGSSFGTLVNGERVETAKLQEGDEILLGSRKLRVVSGETQEHKPTGTARSNQPNAPVEPATAAPAPAGPTAPQPASPRTAPQAASPIPRAKGQAIAVAGYAIEKELGRGAMGHVVLATQTSLDRKVALKLLKADLAKDATFVDRFRKEARAAAQLNHPNVVTVFDVGQDGGHHFLAMEYMDGGSVETMLDSRGRIPWDEALGVIRDAASGLVYAESKGIVHRDLKPENLMRSAAGVTKIADLGLAIQVEQEGLDADGGKVFGTPHFIAPEIVRGGVPTPQSDLYSLGATAYRMISGRTPHHGSSAREILQSLISSTPPELDLLVVGIPPKVAKFVHRLLAKEPSERHRSASEVVRDIDELRTQGGGSAAAGAPNKVALIGAAALILGLGGWWLSRPADPEEPKAPSGFRVVSSGDAATVGAPDPEGPRNGPDEITTPAVVPGSAATDLPKGTDASGSVSTSANPEAEFEAQARRAFGDLASEMLIPSERSTRLKQFAVAYAGTDTAAEALALAATLDEGERNDQAKTQAIDEAREAALESLNAAAGLSSTPFSAEERLRAVAQVQAPAELGTDQAFTAARTDLVDQILAECVRLGEAAKSAANEAEKSGFYGATVSALRDHLEAVTIPDETLAFAVSCNPIGLDAFEAQTQEIRTRLANLAGREAEFEAERIQRERALIGQTLGDSFEAQLSGMELLAAAASVRAAAGLVRNDVLRSKVERTASDLDVASKTLDQLILAWNGGHWRRKAVTDPRTTDGKRAEVVGVAPPRALLFATESGAPERIPLGTWSGNTKSLENLFLKRLDRNWTAEESRGIVTLLAVSGTIEALDALGPSLGRNAVRLRSKQEERARVALEEARLWADGDPELLALAERHAGPVLMLIDALRAREEGRWAESAVLLQRMIEEERASLLVMILSDGGKR